MPPTQELSEKMQKLLREAESAREHQERRHDDWNENWELYRNKVATNRLTQRQAVNIPLMKETIKTALSKIDDPPSINWRERSGDEFKELVYQEIWDETFKEQKLDWLDVLDKKNVLLYGLSTKKLNPIGGKIEISVMDTFDITFDPLMDALDIESARFIIHRNIFRSLREVLADDRYSEKGKQALRIWADSEEGMLHSQEMREDWEAKMDRMRSMGVQHSDFPLFAAGDVLVNLSEHYSEIWDTEKQEFVRHVIVYADRTIELMDELLIDLIGINEYPFVVWYEDPETNDIYPDGVADLVRTPNKVINVWYSQLVESRTLSNFKMHWFDSTDESFTPQTYEPGPGRMLPAPGRPRDTIMPVDVSGLDDSMNAIDFITRIVERGSGAVAIDKGVNEQKDQTLGEVEILVGKSMERSVAMQKFYRGSWYELAKKWDALMHANAGRQMSLYKTGRKGRLYEMEVTKADWQSKPGYEPIVSSTSEQEVSELKTLQKFQFVQQQSPANQSLKRISMKRQLESLDLTPDELKEIQEEEQQLNQGGEEAQVQQPEAAVGLDNNAENNTIQSIEDSLTELV